MMRLHRLAALAITLYLPGACVSRPAEPMPAPVPEPALSQLEHDPHSFARPNEVRVTHVALDLTANFETKRLSGTAALDLQRAPMSTEVILDTRDLDIQEITD